MTPDPINEEARKCFEELLEDNLLSGKLKRGGRTEVEIIQRHMAAYAIAYHEAQAKELVRDIKCRLESLTNMRMIFDAVDETLDAARKERE